MSDENTILLSRYEKTYVSFFLGKPEMLKFTQPLWKLTHKRKYLHGDLQDELDNELSKK